MSNENILLAQGGFFAPTYPMQTPIATVNYTHLPANPLNFAPSPPVSEPFTYVSLDELKALLPPDKQDEKIETGVLPDGRAYAPRSARKDRYCLFAGKIPYILYFTQYYFSKENIDRDGIFRSLMDENYSIPLEQVIKAPRLASVNTTIEELKNAVETGSDLLVIVSNADGSSSLRRKDNYPGSTLGTNSLLQADSTRASFDSRASNSDRPTPTASVNPEIDPSVPAPLQPYPVIRFHPPNTLDPSSMIYQTQNLFCQPPARPSSVTAPSVNPNTAAITQLTSFMSGMNLGQPGQPNPQAAAAAGNPHHPSAQHANQFFNPMSNIAAALAAINARNPGFQFAAPFPPNLFPPNPSGQPRPGAPPTGNIPQPFFAPHQQQAVAAQRRVSPPPHAGTVPTQQQTSANVSANVLNLQIPGTAPPLYNMHNPHDAHFAHAFPPAQSYDSAWLTEGAALISSGNFSHLGYPTPPVMSGAPIMAWPPNQPPPPQIRSTQHHHPIPQASGYQLYNVSLANLLPTQVAATSVNQPVSVATTVSSEGAKSPNAPNSSTVVPTTSVASSSGSSSIGGKDDSVTSSATAAAGNDVSAPVPVKKHSVSSNHQQTSGSTTQQHSRPNSSGSNKSNKYNNKSASGKGGGVQHHHHQRGHNRAPGNSMGPVSPTAPTSTTTVTSNSNAVASSPPTK